MAKKHGLEWWMRLVVHNWVAHPLLVVGEVAGLLELDRVESFIHELHDSTIPDDDPRNVVRLADRR